MKEPTARQAKALQLCREGLAWSAIAAAMGTSRGSARQLARAAELKELRATRQAAKSTRAEHDATAR